MNKGKPLIFLILLSLIIFNASAQDNSTQEDKETAIIQIDDSTKIVNASWGSNGVKLVFKSDMPRVATLVDANSMPDSGAGKVNFKRTKLSVGLTEVNMDLESKRGSKTATISVGNNLVAISNPTQPLLENITRSDFYIEAVIVAIIVPIQVLFRLKWFRYRLKKGLNRVI